MAPDWPDGRGGARTPSRPARRRSSAYAAPAEPAARLAAVTETATVRPTDQPARLRVRPPRGAGDHPAQTRPCRMQPREEEERREPRRCGTPIRTTLPPRRYSAIVWPR